MGCSLLLSGNGTDRIFIADPSFVLRVLYSLSYLIFLVALENSSISSYFADEEKQGSERLTVLPQLGSDLEPRGNVFQRPLFYPLTLNNLCYPDLWLLVTVRWLRHLNLDYLIRIETFLVLKYISFKFHMKYLEVAKFIKFPFIFNILKIFNFLKNLHYCLNSKRSNLTIVKPFWE